MKDKELAEEYVKKEGFRVGMFGELDNITSSEANKEIEQAFLAGLRAGRLQWHDLRKNPNDLPKDYAENTRFLCSVKGETLYLIRYGSFWQGNFEVDAWCEIPTFDKE